MKASVVIDVSMDTDNNKIKYDVALKEGDCTGLNQIAHTLMKSVKKDLSLNSKNQRSNSLCQQ